MIEHSVAGDIDCRSTIDIYNITFRSVEGSSVNIKGSIALEIYVVKSCKGSSVNCNRLVLSNVATDGNITRL